MRTAGSDAPTTSHLADPGDLRDALRDHGGRFVVERRNVVDVRLQAQHQDRRIGGVHFAIRRIGRQVRGQIGARRVDAGFHVARRAVDIAAQIELQGDAGGAQACSTRSSR